MKVRTLTLTAVLFLLVVFAAINWEAFTASYELSFLFGSIYLPLGVFMLGIVAVLGVVFLLFLAKAETLALIEAHRQSKELEKARKLADDQEVSRFNELRQLIEDRFDEIEARLETPADASRPPAP